jgi:hypothetical protein
VPDALSRELSAAHHCLSPASGDAETLRCVSERKQVPRHWSLLYQAWINKCPTPSIVQSLWAGLIYLLLDIIKILYTILIMSKTETHR